LGEEMLELLFVHSNQSEIIKIVFLKLVKRLSLKKTLI